MRLIDADELMDMMYHEAFETDSELQKWDSGCWIRYKMLENVIEKVPTVEKRKTGKWIFDGICGLMCSECHETAPYRERNYCPRCGMKAEGEEKI